MNKSALIIFIGLACSCFSGMAQLTFNELSPFGGLIEEEENWDWFEITNTGDASVFLGDYYLSDDPTNLQKWPCPQLDIQPNEILLIAASGLDINQATHHWESLVLAENNWSYFPGDEEPPENWNELVFDDSSWSSGPGGFGFGDGDDNTEVTDVLSIFIRNEFTIENINDIQSLLFHADYDDGYVAYLNGQEIARSETMSGNPPAFDDAADGLHEAQLYQGLLPESVLFNSESLQEMIQPGNNVLCVQIHNNGIFSSDLSGNFFLSAGIMSSDYNYQETPVWFEVTETNEHFHSSFKLSSGETLILSDAAGNIEDQILIPEDLSQGLSFGRSPDGIGDWCYFDESSPGESNGMSWCFEGVTPLPTILLPSGWYSGTQSTGITSENSTVYYTMNGDVPEEDDNLFSDLIVFEQSTVLSARAFSNGNLLPSKPVDRTYLIDENNFELPVISIHTDSVHLWDWNEGIYVSGPNAGWFYPYFGSNFWQPWSKFTRMEYFDGDQNKLAEEELDLEIHGGWSRAEPQKSFRLDFKSVYTGRLELPLFTQKPDIVDVNNINVRAGGQHLDSDKYQDGLISRISNDLNLDNMAFEPCILYLNGDYWGIYAMREKVDEHYVESNHGIPAEALDLLNSNGALVGDEDEFILAHAEITALSPDDNGFYSLFDSHFELDNYTDYFITETFIQNHDWMGIAWGANNIKCWRPHGEFGKWHYVMYDTDGALGAFGQGLNDNYIQLARNPSSPTLHSAIFDHVLENEQYKCEFVNRYADLMNTTFQPENFEETSEEIKEQLFDAMPDHVARWNAPASVDFWLNEVDNMVNYAQNRLGYARNHVESNLDMDGQVNITLQVYPEGAGSIQISTITPQNYPWEGIYFHNCGVQVTATANPGFEFDFWSEDELVGEWTENPSLLLDLFQDGVLTANFEVDENPIGIEENPLSTVLSLHPNPSSGIINVSLVQQGITSLTFEVINNMGQLVMSKQSNTTLQNHVLDLSYLSNGVYTLLVRSNGDVFSKQLLIQD